MPADEYGDDVQAIEAVIARQFASLSWTLGTPADWDRFVADFFPEASLYPATRPAKRLTIEAFVERMRGLEGTKLRSFEEAVLGTEIHVFGNVAAAVAVCEMTENGAEVHRGVEMLLLIKDAGAWDVMADCITVNEAAQLMRITRRQVFRLCCRSEVRNDLQQVLAEPPAAVRESREITGQQPGKSID